MTKTKWQLDPAHSELGFKIKHLMIANVSGAFKVFDVKVETDGDDFSTARVDATVDIQSIDTKQAQRDQHLRTGDFFEADKFPQAKFTSKKIEKKNDDTFAVSGDLTMKGITKPITFDVEFARVQKDPYGTPGRAALSINGKINRSEWGITYNSVLETGGLALGEEVKLFADVQVVKEASEVLA